MYPVQNHLDMIAQYGASYLIPPDRPQFITKSFVVQTIFISTRVSLQIKQKEFHFSTPNKIAETLKNIKMH